MLHEMEQYWKFAPSSSKPLGELRLRCRCPKMGEGAKAIAVQLPALVLCLGRLGEHPRRAGWLALSACSFVHGTVQFFLYQKRDVNEMVGQGGGGGPLKRGLL